MKVDPAMAKGGQHQYQSTTYYFCNPKCREKFANHPESYLSPAKPEPKAMDLRIYTCPMDPEIRQQGPGNCPICGMALEPEKATLDDAPNPERLDFTRRFWWAVVFTVPLMGLAMSDLIPGQPIHHALSFTFFAGIQCLLATPVVLISGWPFLKRGWISIRTLRLNMFTLISMGTSAAYAYSVIAMLFPHIFPETMRAHAGFAPLYFEAAAGITTLVLLGQILELRAREKTGRALRSLLDLAPKIAHRISDAEEIDIPLQQVQIHDVLRIRPGEKIPTDGIVLEGHSVVDESMMTGESVAIEKNPGDPLTGATLNGTGSLLMRVSRVGSETMLSQIVNMVSKAQRSRAPIQGLADRVSAIFVPTVLLISVITAVLWFWVGPEPKLTYSLLNAVAVLLIACPCALGLATPMSIMVGVGKGASSGILIKDARALENLSGIDTLVLDKTGTLTKGRPSLLRITPRPPFTENEILSLAVAVESHSEHPLSRALTHAAKNRMLPLLEVQDFASTTGSGLSGTVESKKIHIGKSAFLEEHGVDTTSLLEQANADESEGRTVLWIAVDGALAGMFTVHDEIKQTSHPTLETLKSRGINIIMATGDRPKVAKTVADAVGIEEIHSECSPGDKAQLIRKLQSEGKKVAMAGDGINDAPGLAQADVSIAMGTGSDVALETADMTLLHGDLLAILRAHRLSEKTMSNIRQNLFFAFIYNTIGIPIAAGVLYPFFGLFLSPMLASFAMSLSSVSVIINALRLRTIKL